MATYLITGGAGFIGSNFVLYLLDKYEDARIINVDKLSYAGNLQNLKTIEGDKRHHFVHGDICDQVMLSDLFHSSQIDYVVNFAAESHVDRSIEEPETFAQVNVMGTVNLLNAAKTAWEEPNGGFGKHRFLQISTDEVYGSLGETGYFCEDTPLDPHSPYSASKAASDMFVKAYGDTYAFPINITRCSNNYGPFQFPEKLIPLMINNSLQHKSLPIYGDGLNVRDWLYVEDHCKAIDMVLEKGTLGEVYNIGGHNERPNIFIVEKVIEYLNKNADTSITEELITYVEDRKGHDRRYGIDPEKIKRDLGWYPETSFEVGIEKTIQWYLDNQTWVNDVTSGAYQDYYKRMYGER